MNLPQGAEPIGTPADQLTIAGAGAHTHIKLTAEGQRRLTAGLPNASGEPAGGKVLLILENIRGTFDAAMLNAYINLPEGADPQDYRHLLAGSVGLYGLRMASMPQAGNGGKGLTKMFDITPILRDPSVARAVQAGAVRVSIVPNQPLPESSDLVVERVSIVGVPPK